MQPDGAAAAREYPHALPAGHSLEKYEIVRVLGSGGFGITYLATDGGKDQMVAIKEYFPDGHASRAGEAQVVPAGLPKTFDWGFQCFLDEAQVLQKFRHPNVVGLHGHLRANGTVYLVLDYVEGTSLSAILESCGHLPLAEWRPWLDRLLDGLEYVHAHNYLHRDITPRNILIRTADNQPVLIDFGAARIAAGERTRTVVLTEAYAPIEQHSARARQGHFTDIYSLAAVSYRVLTGEAPPPAPAREAEDEYVPLARRFPDAREWVVTLDRALAKAAKDRPQTVGEWRKELDIAAKLVWRRTGRDEDMSLSDLATSTGALVPAPRRSLRVIGIDLGTTNSAIAEIRLTAEGDGAPEPRCVDVEQSTRQGPQIDTVVPSVLAFHEGQYYVGAGAKDLRARLGDLKLERNRNIFWDCKNDIGVRRTYHKAKPGFRSAKEIAGHLLTFLVDSASHGDCPRAETVTITVPASFQAAQRDDTLDAARLANLDLSAGALLDEPVAAFLDYVFSHGVESLAGVYGSQRLAVFDFGGGTCDVALFELTQSTKGHATGIGVAPLSVSRYHRLGGGDIDRAIVVEVLIPQLMDQNGLQPHELDYRAKADFIIPALLGCAEALKIGLCREVARLKKLGRYGHEQSSTLVQKNPAVYPCTLSDGSTLRLQSPTLSSEQFDAVLEPFLDRDLLHPRETDYLMTCSVFAPLQDAAERARLDAHDISLCLFVGGSSLIPQVAEAVDDFFANARMLHFRNPERIQTAVARGAAWQALSLAVRGQGLVRPITGDSISIRTKEGPLELIPSGTPLPYPRGGDWAAMDRLVVPRTGTTQEPLRVELLGSDERVLMRNAWTVPATVVGGDPLRLRYRMDANQKLELRLSARDAQHSAEDFETTVENPLTSVVNPNAKRERILDLEERMRTGDARGEDPRAIVKEIATLESELGNHERALSLLGSLNRLKAEVGVLHRMGMIAGKSRDHEREEKFYRAAADMSRDWNGPLFNLALSQRNQGRLREAMETISQALACQRCPSTLVLKATLIDKMDGAQVDRDSLVNQALVAFGSLATLSKWELGWYVHGARLIGDDARQKAAEAERKRRGKDPESAPDGVLPETKHEIVRAPR